MMRRKRKKFLFWNNLFFYSQNKCFSTKKNE